MMLPKKVRPKGDLYEASEAQQIISAANGKYKTSTGWLLKLDCDQENFAACESATLTCSSNL